LFTGNNSLSSEIILEKIQHYPTSWFSDVILFEDPFLFSKDIFEKDKVSIIRLYQREGFINVKIEHVIFSKNDDNKSVEIKIDLKENNPILVDSVEFIIDNEDLKKQIPKIKQKLLLKSKKRFIDELIKKDESIIINSFINNGYPYVDVNYSLDLDTSKSEVDIKWEIDLGRLSRFGNFSFVGNERTELNLLESKVSFQYGDLYDRTELDTTQKKIYDLGLFYIVSVNAQLDKTDSNRIPVVINIEEAPRFNTKFGLGYGRDEKFRISLDQKWLAFLGGARQLSLYAKYSSLEPYNIRLSFLQPDFLWVETTLSSSGFLLRQTEPGFTINRLGANVSLRRPLFLEIFGSIKYTFENSNLDINSISQVEREEFNIAQIYNKSSLELGFERITSKPLFNPDNGTFTAVAIHYSGLGFGSKYHFLRPTIDFRKYSGLTEWMIFAFRIKAGTIFCYDDDKVIPFEERFYSGGSSSIRGWERSQLGPKDNNGKPIGGKSLFETNLELRYPIYSILSGVAFLDFGNVWSNELTYKLKDLRYSSGLGLRVDTPIGPVRLDFAIPIYEGAAKLQYFISVGHAF
jgi:outer membrane protein insertion porin family